MKNNHSPEFSELDILFLEKQFLKNPDFLCLVLKSFRRSYRFSFEQMRNNLFPGKEVEFANAVHSLRSAVINFVRNSLTDELSHIEYRARVDRQVVIGGDEVDQIEGKVLLTNRQLFKLVRHWRSSEF